MREGWVRDWTADSKVYFSTLRNARSYRAALDAQAQFRKDYRAHLRADADELSNSLAELDWSATFEILDWSAGDDWARIEFEGQTGFIASDSIVEIAYVKRPVGSSDPKDLKIRLEMSRDRHADLIWGDLVQIIRHTETKAYVRSRGLFGYVELDELASEGLLECYIIDVGQGDGVLIRYPDGTHMMIDGGMIQRSKGRRWQEKQTR